MVNSELSLEDFLFEKAETKEQVENTPTTDLTNANLNEETINEVTSEDVESIEDTGTSPSTLPTAQTVEEPTNKTSSEQAPIDENIQSDLLALAREFYEEYNFEEPFNEQWFKDTYGAGDSKELDLNSIKRFNKEVIEHNSKPVFANEIVEKFNDYVLQGGDPKKIASILQDIFDYSSIPTQQIENDAFTQEYILEDYLKVMFPKETDEFYAQEINGIKENGMLATAAKKALPVLIKKSNDEIAANIAAEKANKQKEAERVEKYWKDQEARINAAQEIAGIKIDERGKQNFFKWYSTGGFNKSLNNPERLMELAFIEYKGGAKAFDKKAETNMSAKLAKVLKRQVDEKATIKSPEIAIDTKKKTSYKEELPVW